MLKTLGRALSLLFFPARCELCGRQRHTRDNGAVCQDCFHGVAVIPKPHCPACGRTTFSEGQRCGACGGERFHFDRVYACVTYEGPMKKLLQKFKFGRKKFLTSFFAGTMARFCEQHLASETRWDVVSVPMDRKRRFERGFNQSELLAARLASSLDRPYVAGALDCAAAKNPQSLLGRAERKNNVRDRFFVKRPETLSGRDVLLVDDILTTGLTASACAKALKDAGARSVTVLAFARGV